MTPLEELRDRWRVIWPDALALWSRFTMLQEPHWCFNERDEKREALQSSFAMIRLTDHAVVISLSQILESGLQDYPLEVMGHEIGHHVYCPADRADQARLVARVRRGLPTKEQHTPLICNLYADILINDRLQRSKGLRMDAIYRHLGSGSEDRMWTFYMRLYEILWNLPRHTLAQRAPDAALDADAALGARVVRVYARDWLKGAGRFAALIFPYLDDNGGVGVKQALRGWLDAPPTPGSEIPDGLAEDDGDEDDAMHPSEDPEVTGETPEQMGEGGRATTGATAPQKRYRGPAEYRDIMRGVGVDVADNELVIRYYRERAMPHLVPFPVRVVPESLDPVPEGLDGWDFGESLEQLDVVESLMTSGTLIPGVTTRQRVWGTSPGSSADRHPVDLYIGIDCSGSMQNPAVQLSFPVLAGAIIALSALRAGSRVMVVLSGEPGSYLATDGFLRDEHEILRVLTGYLGTGYSFGIHRLSATFDPRRATDRPVHIMIVTDHDMFSMLQEKSGKNDGWSVAKQALEKARGGGTYVLHMPESYEPAQCQAMREQGWELAFVQEWEDILPFGRAFSRRKYGEEA